ncbi:MAG: hypothetical protein Q3X94_00980 [Oscillospiraceae bacterium]|nr:hypothetical protein [Oscillospiraceae bacterium]
MKKTLYRICVVVFEITLPLFVVLGAVLVFTQLVGAILGNGAVVLGIDNALKFYATLISCICAFSAFFSSYLKDKDKNQKQDLDE